MQTTSTHSTALTSLNPQRPLYRDGLGLDDPLAEIMASFEEEPLRAPVVIEGKQRLSGALTMLAGALIVLSTAG